jgi:hypothetical protein
VGARASPPWDAEGSSDERDSGISLGVEWSGHPGAPCSSVQLPQIQLPVSVSPGPSETLECGADDSQLKSELARLASEVANLKSILTRKKNASTNQTPSPTPMAQPQWTDTWLKQERKEWRQACVPRSDKYLVFIVLFVNYWWKENKWLWDCIFLNWWKQVVIVLVLGNSKLYFIKNRWYIILLIVL